MGKRNSFSVLITVIFVFFLILGCSVLTGCKYMPGQDPDDLSMKELENIPEEKTKAKLLKEIDHKYQDPVAHYQLGQVYQDEGLWAEAENQYNTALTFDPVYRRAQAGRVRVLMEMGDQQQASTSAEHYINQASATAVGSLKLGLGFQKQELDDYALRCYRQALNLSPNSAKVNRQIGYYYLSKNNDQMAIEYLTRSFQLDRNQPEVAGQLGKLGVVIEIPRSKPESPKKLDQIVEQSESQ